MNFDWTAEQEELYQRVLGFARAELNHEVREREREHRFGVAEWRRCGAFGLLGLSAPERHRGLGLGALTTARAIEALGAGCEDMGLVFSISAHLFACVMPIAQYGGEALRERVLARLCSGEWIGANAITEPEAGSDVYALRATAVRDGDTYVLDGTKTYVTNGPVADCIVVYASTQPAHGYLGVSAFVVEQGTPGLSLGQPFVKMGLTTSPTSSLYLQGCRVPASHRLGQEGQGAAVFTASMRWERSCLFAGYLGAMERQLERVIAFARERRQFRKTLGQHQAIAHRIADMKLRLESARLLLYRACWLIDRNDEAALEVSLAKLAVSEAAIRSGLDAIQIHGGLGYIADSGVEQMLRDAIPATIFSGTSEIQRDIIARRLGL